MVAWVHVTGRDFIVTGLVDLGIHELGHLLAIAFGQTIHFLAGSALQVAAPLGLAAYFWWRQDAAASAFMLAWTSTSMVDVSIYMADARDRQLPLIGGTHDWGWLFRHWGGLDMAQPVAGFFRFLAALVGMAAIAWLGQQVWVAWQQRAAPTEFELEATIDPASH